MELILICALLALAFIGYILIPLMKLFGYILLLGCGAITFLAMVFILNTPGFAVFLLLVTALAIKNNKPNRTSFI